MPEQIFASKKVTSPKPSPPAAPAPSKSFSTYPFDLHNSKNCISSFSNNSNSSALAPFCSPYICAQLFCPNKGFLTSDRTIKLASLILESTFVASIVFILNALLI